MDVPRSAKKTEIVKFFTLSCHASSDIKTSFNSFWLSFVCRNLRIKLIILINSLKHYRCIYCFSKIFSTEFPAAIEFCLAKFPLLPETVISGVFMYLSKSKIKILDLSEISMKIFLRIKRDSRLTSIIWKRVTLECCSCK